MQHVQLEAARVVNSVIHGRNLNQVLGENRRQHPEFSPQQKSALQDLSYGTLRNYGTLKFALTQLMERPNRDELLNNLILVALYQLEFSKVGQHVIVDQAVCASKLLNTSAGGLVNAVLRNFLRKRKEILDAAKHGDESLYSYQKWWVKEVRAQYGDRAGEILGMGNQHPPMTLRVNAKHTTMTEYSALLAAQEIEAEVVGPNALKLVKPVAVERLPRFSEGWVSVQDAGAQYAALLLDVKEGMRVLDACSAPGGKTAHLLELADIELIALDKDEQRLSRVKENLQRTGLIAKILCGDAASPRDWWDGETFQRILADVPCSASGVVRRHPDIKWLRRPEDITFFAKQQSSILEALWPLLAENGKLLYATCSIFKQENQNVIDVFLGNHPEATQQSLISLQEGQLLPNEQHDGFFYALLQKNS